MHAGGRGSDYEKNERMKMDPRDTVKLRASLVTQRDAETYSGPRPARGRGEIGGRDEGRKEGRHKWGDGRRERLGGNR